jgi:murein DD-endopeptidase MepM/ murein hydrolase activator NlpD
VLNIGHVFSLLFSRLGLLLTPTRGFLFKIVFLPLYGRYLWLKSKLIKAAPSKKDQFLLIFTNRYLIHILILIIGLGVAFSNLLAYESKEDYGQNALVYKLVGISDVEIIEDNNTIADEAKSYNYQDQVTYIEGNSFAEVQNSDTDNIFTDQATTQGDLALIKPDILNTNEAKASTGTIHNYEVVEGDTLSSIARRFGVSLNTVLWANNLSFSSYVKPGQKLVIPSVSGVIHKVVRGDTLSKIAQKYGVVASVITEANGLSDTSLALGNNLIIPGGKIIETSKPRTVATNANQKPKSQPAINVSEELAVSGTGKMVWPNGCYRISQYFKGWRHTGVDIACPWGTPLHAADSGRVTRVQYGKTGYGYNVIIDHGGGISTLYGHMSSIDVSQGEYVERGQVIGAEGSTGRSTGPHLHFEVRIRGTQVNPLSYIR